jgi:protein-S-isoprenylcysteine O-methyltransferase Ste14
VIGLSAGVFALAVAINCLSVHAQRRHRAYDRLGRWGWPAHIALLTLAWGGAIVCFAFIKGRAVWPLAGWVRPLGIVVGALASLTFGAALRELGLQSLFNGNFFGRAVFSERGIYRVLANPMYDAFLLAFVSLALRRADAIYFLFALESLVGLNLIEARVERVELPDAAAGPRRGAIL